MVASGPASLIMLSTTRCTRGSSWTAGSSVRCAVVMVSPLALLLLFLWEGGHPPGTAGPPRILNGTP